MQKHKQRLLNILWITLPLVSALLALCVGRYGLSFREVISALLSGPMLDTPAVTILYKSRLPRVILAFIVGAGLSVAGCCFQSIFANPLASPDTLGVSSGAAFGAALGLLFSFGMLGTQLMAMIIGIAAVGVTFLLSNLKRGSGILMLILAGVISSSFFNALISAVKYLADPLTKLPEITYWLMGSMLGASYQDILLALPFIALPIAILYLLRWKLNILTLPDDEASALGINPSALRWLIIVLCTLIISACVSVSGQVSWVGLVIPHIARRIAGTDHCYTLPACISIGGVYMVLVDTLARTLSAGELPLSILTAIIGLPIFVILFFKKGAAGFAS